MHSTLIPYHDGPVALEGFVVHPREEKRPLVILCHAWSGRDEFICEKARLVAKQGYVGFALDMYGKGILGKSKEEKAALKKPFIQDRRLLQRRAFKALDTASRLDLARHCRTDITMTSQVLRTLEKKGYIKRCLRDGNERSKFPRVTERGSRLIEQAIPLVEQIDRQFFDKLKENTKHCVEILQKLAARED
jgi:DNA-binding MarR family transcriptional regulator